MAIPMPGTRIPRSALGTPDQRPAIQGHARLTAMAATLVLPVKAEFFHAIKSGDKTEEYRLQNGYWAKRLEGKAFDQVVITWGYPSRLDLDKRIVLPWRGMRKTTIQHALFDPAPVAVYAIDVRQTIGVLSA